jgi:hypothetical protein
MAMMDTLLPGIGHNQPPEIQLDPARLEQRLKDDYADMLGRFVELQQGCARAPARVDTEEAANTLLDFIAEQCRKLVKDASAAHTKEKKPYRESGKVVDTFFLRRIETFEVAVAKVQRTVDDYLNRKRQEMRRQEDERRRQAAEEARKQREEADRLEAEARKKAAGSSPADRRTAVQLGRQAEEAAAAAAAATQIVDAPPAPVRLHGEYGATAYTKQEVEYDIDPDLLPDGWWIPNMPAIAAARKRGIVIPGVTDRIREKTIIKRC